MRLLERQLLSEIRFGSKDLSCEIRENGMQVLERMFHDRTKPDDSGCRAEISNASLCTVCDDSTLQSPDGARVPLIPDTTPN